METIYRLYIVLLVTITVTESGAAVCHDAQWERHFTSFTHDFRSDISRQERVGRSDQSTGKSTWCEISNHYHATRAVGWSPKSGENWEGGSSFKVKLGGGG